MPSVSHVYYPFNSNSFTIELYTSGNSPDYSIIYNQGVQAGRGESESYVLKNCPKGDTLTEIEVTCNTGTDSMKFNYIGIDYGATGDGKKWYFVKNKRLINYPKPESEGGINQYAVLFSLELDYWETYKDKIGNPTIFLNQVTTNNPSGWEDISMLEQDVLPFSGTNISTSDIVYSDWKTIVGWQSKKPTDQDNYVIDGMRTTLQFNDTGDLSDYLNGLDDLASGTPEETNIWRSYIVCNTYIVSQYFSTENGGKSDFEQLQLSNPPSTQIHNRLNYFPYKRAFVSTIDGQNVEIDYKRYDNNKLPLNIIVNIFHSTLPQPTSVLYIAYSKNKVNDAIVFKAYPTMDLVGRNITPTTQITNIVEDFITSGQNWILGNGWDSDNTFGTVKGGK